MLLKNFYSIVTTESLDPKSFTTIVDLQKKHDIFKGHFPNFPVTPGVGMLQIIKELTQNYSKHDLFLESASQVKFLTLVDPNKNPRLKFAITLNEDSETVKVKNVTSFEDGTIVLKCNVNFAKR